MSSQPIQTPTSTPWTNAGRSLFRQLSACRLLAPKERTSLQLSEQDISSDSPVRSSSMNRGRSLRRLMSSSPTSTAPCLPSRTGSPPSSSKDHRRRLKQSKSLSQSCRNIALTYRNNKSNADVEDEDLEALLFLSSDLERMARVLGKVDNPERILLKHLQMTSPSSSAA